jgi:hypothetical protein
MTLLAPAAAAIATLGIVLTAVGLLRLWVEWGTDEQSLSYPHIAIGGGVAIVLGTGWALCRRRLRSQR